VIRLARPALLAAGLLGAALVLHLHPFGALFAPHPGHGWRDALALGALGALACAVGMPRQVIGFAAGFAWGVIPGTALALASQLAGCAADLLWARLVGRAFVRSRLGHRAVRIDRALAARPFTATLTLRLMPLGSNLALNLLAGVSSVKVFPFLAGSALGFVPQTVIFALIGAGGRVGRDVELAVGVVLFVISIVLAFGLRRRIAPELAGV
jgi:uncharacterized membrane protein YdjX (TVP38/TMEM64 family)